jgi:hypothetical protein
MARVTPAERGRGRGDRPGSGRPRFFSWLVPAILSGLLLSGCATGALDGPTPANRVDRPAFEVGRDTFAFPNLVRSHHPERHVDFANYCILMARAASQFFRFARFAPAEPPVSEAEYARRIGEVMRISAWAAPRPDAERVVIPGYPSLFEFSRAHEATLKASFGSNILSMVHWRTWRAGFPLAAAHQERVARQLRAELDAGRPAPVMITNFPDPDVLNHAVLVYEYRLRSGALEFLAYDPNDPASPLGLHFDPLTRGFWVEPLPYSPPGRVRAFRLYTSPLL